MKKNIYRRFAAFIIDMMLISAVVSLTFYLLTYISPIKKEYEKYNKYYNEIQEQAKKYKNKKITVDEYNDYVKESTYYLDRYNVIYTSLTLVAIISYFVVYAYYKNGVTFGKKVCKLQIKSVDSKKISMLQLFIRSLFLYSIVTNVFKLVLLLCAKETIYNNIIYYYTTIYSVAEMLVLLSILVSKNNRGIHDMLAKTEVISTAEDLNQIKEADYKEIKDEENAGSN